MAAKRFTKGQTVYYASTQFATDSTASKAMTALEMRVISRVIDSCGAKKMTFVDRGRDSVYGQSALATAPCYFSDPSSAFAYLADVKAKYHQHTPTVKVVIYPDLVGDDVWIDPTI